MNLNEHVSPVIAQTAVHVFVSKRCGMNSTVRSLVSVACNVDRVAKALIIDEPFVDETCQSLYWC